MNRRFAVLALVCALPWLYGGAGLLLGITFHGLWMIPFFALLFAKEMALKTQKEREEVVARNDPYWKDLLIVVGAVLLAVVVMVLAMWVAGLGEAYVTLARFVASVSVVGLFIWDLRRAFLRAA